MYNLKQTYATITFKKESIDLVLSTNDDKSMHLLRQITIENTNLYDENKVINKTLLQQKIQQQLDLINQRSKMLIQKVILNFDGLINDLKSTQVATNVINYLSADQFHNEIKKFVFNSNKTKLNPDQIIDYKIYKTVEKNTKNAASELVANTDYYAILLVYHTKSNLLADLKQTINQLGLKVCGISSQELNYLATQQLKDASDSLVIDVLDDHTSINIYLDDTFIISRKMNVGLNQVKANVFKKLNPKNNNNDLNDIIEQYFNNALLNLAEDSSYNLLIKTSDQFLNYQYLSKQDLDACIQKYIVPIVDHINKELELIKQEFKKEIKQIIINTNRNSAIANNLLNKENELVNDVEISKLYSLKLWSAKKQYQQSYLAIKKQYEFDLSINKIDNHIISQHDYNYDHESDKKAILLSINKEINSILTKLSAK
ncbi:MPN316 family protein [Mycoplasma sp. E35C]|uniref:MPN316 family protein n=1 Tax=Mycoplasma sp. E35C TaxID=2801918 RepID=UPI001CA40AE7|nr:hypothetical protein [Mycoplasma sp. E35C]QZX48843.1 hypothetical protein JJE79_02160 [Mycoplasma sp. E35C]